MKKQLLGVLCVFALAATSLTVFADEPVKIGFVNMSSGNPVFYDLEKGAKETAEELGVDLQWVAPETADSVKEAELIEQLANSGVQAIAVVPYDDTLLTTMQAVSDKGIYVAEVSGSNITYDGLSFVVGTNQYNVGHDVGLIAAEALTDKEKTYKFAIITDLSSTSAFEDRIKGFTDALDDAGIKYEEIGKISCEDDISKAVEGVETFTSANPDMDMWFFAGGWPLMTDVSALPNLQKWHEEEGHYCFSVDAFPPMEAFFDEGICDGCSGQFYHAMGEISITFLDKLIKGEELPEPDNLLEHDNPFYSSGSLAITPADYKDVFSTMTPWN